MSISRRLRGPVSGWVVACPIMRSRLASHPLISNGHAATAHLPLRALRVTTTYVIETFADLETRLGVRARFDVHAALAALARTFGGTGTLALLGLPVAA